MRVPAGDTPLVSAKIPSLPVKSKLEVLIVIEPPPSVLVEVAVAVALISASLPMVRVSEVMVMSPALPAAEVSTVSLLFVSRVTLLAFSMVMLPLLPMPDVVAETVTPSLKIRFGVLKVMSPAFPDAEVSLLITLLLRVVVPPLIKVTFPARLIPLVSAKMLVLLRVKIPWLLIEKSPDCPVFPSVSNVIVLGKKNCFNSMLTC